MPPKACTADDIETIYTPLGQSDWREIVQRIKTFGSQGKKTAVISTVSGDANGYLYNELAAQQVEARKIPVMALSVSERELRSADASRLTGHMAARNYFQSVTSPENEAFVKMWADFTEQRDKTTNDPMEATFIGFRMWAQAVTQAGTTDANAVRQAMYGQRVKAPSGFEVVMNTNHHLSKPAMIGKLNPTVPSTWSGARSTRSRPRSGADIFPRARNLLPIGRFPGFAADAPSRHSRNGDKIVSAGEVKREAALNSCRSWREQQYDWSGCRNDHNSTIDCACAG